MHDCALQLRFFFLLLTRFVAFVCLLAAGAKAHSSSTTIALNVKEAVRRHTNKESSEERLCGCFPQNLFSKVGWQKVFAPS
jgi:hypothetical protein